MTFDMLGQITVPYRATNRTIALYQGDLSRIPPDHALDLLVLSAFPNDYAPTPTSLIGALWNRGVDVAALAADKQTDLREQCAFWLSRPIGLPAFHARRIACFEHRGLGTAPQLVGDLFRGLFPFLDPAHDQVVGMSLLSTGDQRGSAVHMMHAILEAGTHWLGRGLPVRELKIVVRPGAETDDLAAVMDRYRPAPLEDPDPDPDVFLSYASQDAAIANRIHAALEARADIRAVFNFKTSLRPGMGWLKELDGAIRGARAMIAVLSPDYMRSKYCEQELMCGQLRHLENGPYMFPVWWRDVAQIELWLRTVQMIDCRECDQGRLLTQLGGLRLPAQTEGPKA